MRFRTCSNSRRSLSLFLIACCLVAALIFFVWEASPFQAQDYVTTKKILHKFDEITIGMTSDSIVALIGRPAYIERYPKMPSRDMCRYVYFTEVPRCTAFPAPLQIAFTFCGDGKCLVEKEEPYGTHISENGVPTTPIPMQPIDGSMISADLLNSIDFRWKPSHGACPKKYYLEVSNCTHNISFTSASVRQPYTCLALPFFSTGCIVWRVRAENKLGTSPWSNWQLFVCTNFLPRISTTEAR